MTKDEERRAFLRHLQEARQVVGTWPIWKQTLLGGRPVVKDASSDPQSK